MDQQLSGNRLGMICMLLTIASSGCYEPNYTGITCKQGGVCPEEYRCCGGICAKVDACKSDGRTPDGRTPDSRPPDGPVMDQIQKVDILTDLNKPSDSLPQCIPASCTTPADIDDFEDSDYTSKLGTSWDTWHTPSSSTIKVENLSQTISGCGVGRSLKISGTLAASTASVSYGQVLVGLGTSGPCDISSYSHLEFCAKGDGKSWRLMLEQSNITNKFFYGESFSCPTTGTKVSIDLGKLSHEQPAGTQVPWCGKSVSKLSFRIGSVNSPSPLSYECSIDNVRFVK